MKNKAMKSLVGTAEALPLFDLVGDPDRDVAYYSDHFCQFTTLFIKNRVYVIFGPK